MENLHTFQSQKSVNNEDAIKRIVERMRKSALDGEEASQGSERKKKSKKKGNNTFPGIKNLSTATRINRVASTKQNRSCK